MATFEVTRTCVEVVTIEDVEDEEAALAEAKKQSEEDWQRNTYEVTFSAEQTGD